MTDLQEEIINELYEIYKIPKVELNRIVSSQFRLVERIITNKECKTINCMYLGKFYPTTYRKKLEDGKTRGNISGLEERSV